MEPERPGREDGEPGLQSRRSLPLSFLALLFVFAEPLGVAVYAAGILQSLIDRGPWAVLLLLARLAITAVGVGAGLALWHQRPGAVAFARLALALAAGGVLLTFLSPVFPRNRPPGATAPLVTGLLLYYGAWFGYLTWVRNPEAGGRAAGGRSLP